MTDNTPVLMTVITSIDPVAKTITITKRYMSHAEAFLLEENQRKLLQETFGKKAGSVCEEELKLL